jgi:hypothetical protein
MFCEITERSFADSDTFSAMTFELILIWLAFRERLFTVVLCCVAAETII